MPKLGRHKPLNWCEGCQRRMKCHRTALTPYNTRYRLYRCAGCGLIKPAVEILVSDGHKAGPLLKATVAHGRGTMARNAARCAEVEAAVQAGNSIPPAKRDGRWYRRHPGGY